MSMIEGQDLRVSYPDSPAAFAAQTGCDCSRLLALLCRLGFCREQFERAILDSAPTMLFVERDTAFVRRVAPRRITLAAPPKGDGAQMP